MAMVMVTVMDERKQMKSNKANAGGASKFFYIFYIKRVFDIVMALILIVLLAIPIGLIAVGVKLTSKGPVLFRQQRFGLHSRPFIIYKFRTMTVDSPILSHRDFRDRANYVTKFGNFLRRTSLDELPQLINILKGDMSFVGPRPLAATDKAVLDLREGNGADNVRPGITGFAQVNGRNRVTDVQKAAYDAKYFSEVSFSCDVRIVAQTFVNVAKQRDVNQD
jgi:O-antigen biosynthesis protein WbqP